MTTPAPAQVLAPVEFDAPLVEPAPGGLYSAVSWADQTGPSRFLAEGVQIRVHNYGGESAFGVWEAPWCGDPGDALKSGTRPGNLDPFDAITVWAFDQCDPTEASRREIRSRAEQNLRLLEPVAVEREFSARLLADAGVPADRAGVQAALGYLEGQIARTGTRAVIHCSPEHAPFLVDSGVVLDGGDGRLRTPLGNLWAFGGGYVDGLGRTLIATSPLFGWRDQVAVREALDPNHSTAVAVAERSLVVGYEQCIAAARLV